MATLLYRLGAFAVRRRWAVLLTWVVLLIVVGAGAIAFKGVMTDSFSIPGTQAQRALNQLNAKVPAAGGATGRIVFAAPAGTTLGEPAYKQAVTDVLTGIKGLPKVEVVIPPTVGRSVSPNGQVGFAQVQFAGQITEIPVATQTAIAQLAAQHEVNGLRIEL